MFSTLGNLYTTLFEQALRNSFCLWNVAASVSTFDCDSFSRHGSFNHLFIHLVMLYIKLNIIGLMTTKVKALEKC